MKTLFARNTDLSAALIPETRMLGALSLWLLSLSREQRESDSP
jgi:hypothetical protein